MPPLISLQHIRKEYRSDVQRVTALDGVSLSVEQGEMVAVVGQSGSGKSTLMNVIGCLDLPTAGRYLLNGRDVRGLSETALSTVRNRDIGFVFQKFHLLAGLSALENVELPLLYRGLSADARRAVAKESLTRVGLAARMHHFPAQLSGGQQQRVAIARAIAARPPLLLADEPTGNLDRAAGETVMALLHELHGAGHTVLLITHDPLIAASAPRVVRLCDGRIAADARNKETGEIRL